MAEYVDASDLDAHEFSEQASEKTHAALVELYREHGYPYDVQLYGDNYTCHDNWRFRTEEEAVSFAKAFDLISRTNAEHWAHSSLMVFNDFDEEADPVFERYVKYDHFTGYYEED